MPTIALLFLLSSLSIIIVRYINNKILRTELYKYYYLDHKINTILLLLPLLYGYIDNSLIDIGVGIIGALMFIIVCVMVSRKKEVIDIMGIGDGDAQGTVRRRAKKEGRDKHREKI